MNSSQASEAFVGEDERSVLSFNNSSSIKKHCPAGSNGDTDFIEQAKKIAKKANKQLEQASVQLNVAIQHVDDAKKLLTKLEAKFSTKLGASKSNPPKKQKSQSDNSR